MDELDAERIYYNAMLALNKIIQRGFFDKEQIIEKLKDDLED